MKISPSYNFYIFGDFRLGVYKRGVDRNVNAFVLFSNFLGRDSKGVPTIRTTGCSSDLDVDVDFHGGKAWIYNMFASKLESKLKSSLQGKVNFYPTIYVPLYLKNPYILSPCYDFLPHSMVVNVMFSFQFLFPSKALLVQILSHYIFR